LVDGSYIAISHYGGWTPKEGWVIEGTGIVPDKEIENDPASFAKGHDDQLDYAVNYLLKEIQAHPVVIPTHPPFPVKTLRGAKPTQ
jgi:tricorn protease